MCLIAFATSIIVDNHGQMEKKIYASQIRMNLNISFEIKHDEYFIKLVRVTIQKMKVPNIIHEYT